MNCQECESSNVWEGEDETKTDGQGFEWTVTRPYSCNECGCEWLEKEHTTKEILKVEKWCEVKCFIPVETDEPVLFDSREEAEEEVAHHKFLQPENIYTIEEVE